MMQTIDDVNGNISRKIDSMTRYLAVGAPPQGTGSSNALSAMVTKQNQATSSGVETIDIEKPRRWMGISGSAKVVRLGRSSEGFRMRTDEDE